MIGTIVKPSIGLSPDELAEVVGELAAAGIDFIKDDELQGNGPTAPLAERVRAVMPVLERHADRTGVKPMYAFNITDDIDRLEANHDLVVAAGGTCVMACVNLVGLAGLEFLRRRAQVPIHGHRAMFGAISRSEQVGFSFRAWQKLARLSGADHLHTNGISNKFYENRRRGARLDRGCARAAARAHPDPAGPLVGPVGRPRARDLLPRSARPTCSCSPAAASTAIRTAPRRASTSMREAWESAGARRVRRGCARALGCAAARRRDLRSGACLSTRRRAGATGCLGSEPCPDCEPRSTATTSPAASTRSCSSRAAAGRGRLFVGLPDAAALARAADGCDVVGIAGIARSLPTAELDAEVRPVLAGARRARAHGSSSTRPARPRTPRRRSAASAGSSSSGARSSASRPCRCCSLSPTSGDTPRSGHALRGGGRHRLPARPAAHDVDPPDDADDGVRPRRALLAPDRPADRKHSVHGIRR